MIDYEKYDRLVESTHEQREEFLSKYNKNIRMPKEIALILLEDYIYWERSPLNEMNTPFEDAIFKAIEFLKESIEEV